MKTENNVTPNAPTAQYAEFRLLDDSDTIQIGDECISSDTLTWAPVEKDRWEIGAPFQTRVFRAMRRRLRSPAPTVPPGVDLKAAFIEAYTDAAYDYCECPKGDLAERAEAAWEKSESKKQLKAAQPAPVRAEAETDQLLREALMAVENAHREAGVLGDLQYGDILRKLRTATEQPAASAPAQSFIRHDGDVEIHDMLKRTPAQSAEPDAKNSEQFAKRDSGDERKAFEAWQTEQLSGEGVYPSDAFMAGAAWGRRRCKDAVEAWAQKSGIHMESSLPKLAALLQSEFAEVRGE